jgi:hypothetical protein
MNSLFNVVKVDEAAIRIPTSWRLEVSYLVSVRYALLVLFLLFVSLNMVLADEEEPNVGILRVTRFHTPSVVAVNSSFPVSIDVEYATHGNASIRAAIYQGVVNYTHPIWESQPTIVDLGGDIVWNVTLRAPPQEGSVNLTAYAFWLDQDVWKFYTDPLNGPGISQVTIKVSKGVVLTVDFATSGVPVSVNDTVLPTLANGRVQMLLPIETTNTVSVPAYYYVDNSTRLAFNGWSDGNVETSRTVLASHDLNLVGSYRIQYLLHVNSPVSSYSEWHDTGALVKLQQPNYQPMNGILGQLGCRYTFDRWSGDIDSSTTQVEIRMDSPKTVNANFQIDLSSVAIPTIVILGLLCGVGFIFYRRASPVHSDLTSETIACSRCGKENKRGWEFCATCGEPLSASQAGEDSP